MPSQIALNSRHALHNIALELRQMQARRIRQPSGEFTSIQPLSNQHDLMSVAMHCQVQQDGYIRVNHQILDAHESSGNAYAAQTWP